MPIGPIRRLIILLLVPILPIVTACSDSAPAPSAVHPTPTAVPQTTVSWSFWGDSWELAVNQRIVRAFERENPDIYIRVEHHPWGEYFTWLRGEWQAGRSPDVMFLNYIPTYVAMGELEPLNAYVARDSVPLDDFYPALLDAFRWEGTLYGLPRDNDTKVIYYNRAHFAEAGIPEPADGWTWADLRAAARALTRHDRVAPRYGFGFEPSYWWLVWVWQNGGEVLDSPTHPTSVLLDSPQNAEALQFLQDLIYTDRVTPPPDHLNTDDMNQLFRDGQLSMVFGNHALVPWLTEATGLLWDVAPLPRNAERINLAGGAGFVMSRRSQQKEAAWTLMRFLSGPKAQAILSESGVITPARRSVRESNIFLRQQRYSAGTFVSETAIGRPVPNFPGVTEMERVIDAGLKPLWRGERPAADILHDLAPQVAAALGIEGY
jgi:multiple sugar transport system substrate-binding protein